MARRTTFNRAYFIIQINLSSRLLEELDQLKFQKTFICVAPSYLFLCGIFITPSKGSPTAGYVDRRNTQCCHLGSVKKILDGLSITLVFLLSSKFGRVLLQITVRPLKVIIIILTTISTNTW